MKEEEKDDCYIWLLAGSGPRLEQPASLLGVRVTAEHREELTIFQ